MGLDPNLYDFSLKNSIWELEPLKYEGPLYHYTGTETCKKIFHPQRALKDCICLRFARIETMLWNDEKERRHIQDTIHEISECLVSNGAISKDFANILLNYQPNDKGIYRIALDKVDEHCGNKIKIGYGLVDYYVACFSTNPYNSHIITEMLVKHPSVDRIDFSSRFVSPESVGDSTIRRMSYPFSALNNCMLEYDIKQVVYDDAQKYELLENEVARLGDKFDGLAKNRKNSIRYDIQSLYALYEAFLRKTKIFIKRKKKSGL